MYTHGDGIRKACKVHVTPTSKLMLILLETEGPLSTKQIIDIMGWNTCDSEHVQRPMALLNLRGIVERKKYKQRYGSWCVIYRVIGDSRDWMLNQADSRNLIEVQDNPKWTRRF